MDITVLGIESSCDETAAAVVVNGRSVLSNVISTQIELHMKYGGVVPEIASRKHMENIDKVIDEALYKAGKTFNEIDCIAVTYGPGLVGALLVGVSHAKALSYALSLPLIGVHHIIGHISSNYLENSLFEPPFIALVASGGHTHLVHVISYNSYEVIGRTQDDAAGEAYDKVARVIGLGYPGGPKIDALSKEGNPDAICFPRALNQEDNYNFSFSGVKSAVLNYVNKCKMMNEQYCAADIAASFQKAVVGVLISKTLNAAKAYNISKIALAGGVAANASLRKEMEERCNELGFTVNIPKPVFCTDNAAMIACAGYYQFIKGERFGLNLNAVPSLSL